MSASSQEYTGGGGQWPPYAYAFKNVDLYDALLKINIFKGLFLEGGVTQKSTLCTLLIMLTILYDSLANLVIQTTQLL